MKWRSPLRRLMLSSSRRENITPCLLSMFGLPPLGVALRLLMIMLSRSSRSVCSAVISLMMGWRGSSTTQRQRRYLHRWSWSTRPSAEAGERGSTISPAVSYLAAHYVTHVFGRGFPSPYLKRSSHSEDTIVGLLGTQTLKRLLHNLILLGNQVVGTVSPPWVSAVLGIPLPSFSTMRFLFLFSILNDDHVGWGAYRRPSFRYPALSKYHSLSGRIQRINHGRFMIFEGARQASPPDEEDRVSKTSRGTMESEEKS
ncbi:hypothetical protein KC326_g159 [Hortaea werneckii]|nr:hypothetical protein KC326_g159 [Hortaea werneckii]